MTERRSFKRLVRHRMARTGESYTAARLVLLAASAPAAVGAVKADVVLPASDATMIERTGRGWEAWFDLLDDEGLAERPRREISRRVAVLLGVHPLAWNAQAVVKGYERARLGRAVGEGEDGFTVTASRTVGLAADPLIALIRADPAGVLADGLAPRRGTAAHTARYDLGATRVTVTVTAVGPAKSTVTVEQSRIVDAAEADRCRTQWRSRLAELVTATGSERTNV